MHSTRGAVAVGLLILGVTGLCVGSATAGATEDRSAPVVVRGLRQHLPVKGRTALLEVREGTGTKDIALVSVGAALSAAALASKAAELGTALFVEYKVNKKRAGVDNEIGKLEECLCEMVRNNAEGQGPVSTAQDTSVCRRGSEGKAVSLVPTIKEQLATSWRDGTVAGAGLKALGFSLLAVQYGLNEGADLGLAVGTDLPESLGMLTGAVFARGAMQVAGVGVPIAKLIVVHLGETMAAQVLSGVSMALSLKSIVTSWVGIFKTIRGGAEAKRGLETTLQVRAAGAKYGACMRVVRRPAQGSRGVRDETDRVDPQVVEGCDVEEMTAAKCWDEVLRFDPESDHERAMLALSDVASGSVAARVLEGIDYGRLWRRSKGRVGWDTELVALYVEFWTAPAWFEKYSMVEALMAIMKGGSSDRARAAARTLGLILASSADQVSVDLPEEVKDVSYVDRLLNVGEPSQATRQSRRETLQSVLRATTKASHVAQAMRERVGSRIVTYLEEGLGTEFGGYSAAALEVAWLAWRRHDRTETALAQETKAVMKRHVEAERGDGVAGCLQSALEPNVVSTTQQASECAWVKKVMKRMKTKKQKLGRRTEFLALTALDYDRALGSALMSVIPSIVVPQLSDSNGKSLESSVFEVTARSSSGDKAMSTTALRMEATASLRRGRYTEAYGYLKESLAKDWRNTWARALLTRTRTAAAMTRKDVNGTAREGIVTTVNSKDGSSIVAVFQGRCASGLNDGEVTMDVLALHQCRGVLRYPDNSEFRGVVYSDEGTPSACGERLMFGESETLSGFFRVKADGLHGVSGRVTSVALQTAYIKSEKGGAETLKEPEAVAFSWHRKAWMWSKNTVRGILFNFKKYTRMLHSRQATERRYHGASECPMVNDKERLVSARMMAGEGVEASNVGDKKLVKLLDRYEVRDRGDLGCLLWKDCDEGEDSWAVRKESIVSGLEEGLDEYNGILESSPAVQVMASLGQGNVAEACDRVRAVRGASLAPVSGAVLSALLEQEEGDDAWRECDSEMLVMDADTVDGEFVKVAGAAGAYGIVRAILKKHDSELSFNNEKDRYLLSTAVLAAVQNGRTAAVGGMEEMVAVAVKKEAGFLENIRDEHHQYDSLLHMAVRLGGDEALAMVRQLLRIGVSRGLVNELGQTAGVVAVHRGECRVAHEVISAGPPLMVVSDSCENEVLMFKTSCVGKCDGCAEPLSDAMDLVDAQEKCKIMEESISRLWQVIIEENEHEPTPEVQVLRECAVGTGMEEEGIFKKLCEDSSLIPEVADATFDDHETLLFSTALSGRAEWVKFLLDLGANPAIPTAHGATALHAAASSLCGECVEAILSAVDAMEDASPRDKVAFISAETDQGRTAEREASQYGVDGHLHIMKMIRDSLTEHKDDMWREEMPLLTRALFEVMPDETACSAPDEADNAIMSRMEAIGTAPRDEPDSKGMNALCYASKLGLVKTVRYLIKAENWSNRYIQSDCIYGRTPAFMAALYGHTEVLRELLCRSGACSIDVATSSLFNDRGTHVLSLSPQGCREERHTQLRRRIYCSLQRLGKRQQLDARSSDVVNALSGQYKCDDGGWSDMFTECSLPQVPVTWGSCRDVMLQINMNWPVDGEPYCTTLNNRLNKISSAPIDVTSTDLVPSCRERDALYSTSDRLFHHWEVKWWRVASSTVRAALTGRVRVYHLHILTLNEGILVFQVFKGAVDASLFFPWRRVISSRMGRPQSNKEVLKIRREGSFPKEQLEKLNILHEVETASTRDVLVIPLYNWGSDHQRERMEFRDVVNARVRYQERMHNTRRAE